MKKLYLRCRTLPLNYDDASKGAGKAAAQAAHTRPHTTEIDARIVDREKQEAVNLIPAVTD